MNRTSTGSLANIRLRPAGVQGYDRYAYANNNPVLYNDPSGHVSCSGSNWDDGPQCKTKGDSKDQYNVLKHPEHFKLTDKQKEVVKYLQGCASQNLQGITCGSNSGTSISAWPPNGYQIARYQTHYGINWAQVDWLGLAISGAGVIGDTATIVTGVAAVVPGAQVIIPFTAPVAAAGEIVNKVGVGYNIYKTITENDPSGSAVDLFTYALKDAGPMIPVVSLGSNISGVIDAVKPAIYSYQQPILLPITPTSIGPLP